LHVAVAAARFRGSDPFGDIRGVAPAIVVRRERVEWRSPNALLAAGAAGAGDGEIAAEREAA
jgi:hypothetical protein